MANLRVQGKFITCMGIVHVKILTIEHHNYRLEYFTCKSLVVTQVNCLDIWGHRTKQQLHYTNNKHHFGTLAPVHSYW